MNTVSKRQRAFRAFLLITGGFCLLSGIFVPWLGRKWMRRDHDAAAQQQAVGQIAFLTAEHEENGVHYDPQVLVRFPLGLKPVSKITNAESKQFIVGQKVNVTYRVGGIGRVYIDSIAPLTQTKAAQ